MRYAVGKVGNTKVYWFQTYKEAVEKIEEFRAEDPEAAANGEYYIDEDNIFGGNDYNRGYTRRRSS